MLNITGGMIDLITLKQNQVANTHSFHLLMHRVAILVFEGGVSEVPTGF